MMDGSFKPPVFSMGIHSVPTYMACLYSWISQVTKFVFRKKKTKARLKEILRKTTVVSRTPHTLISVDLQTHLQDKIYLWNSRRMLCEIGEPLFLIRRPTLRPLIEDTLDKSQTLEGVTLEQKTPYLISIWTIQGSLVDLSIYIFEFVGCSEK